MSLARVSDKTSKHRCLEWGKSVQPWTHIDLMYVEVEYLMFDEYGIDFVPSNDELG